MPLKGTDVMEYMTDLRYDYSEVLKESQQVIRQCLSQYRLDEVFLSFNGGKDCTVLLDMVLNVVKDLCRTNDVASELKVFCIQTTSKSFSELDDFMKQVEQHYSIKLRIIRGEMKTALETILNNDKCLKACFMGTRRTDPYSENLKFMQETDGNWPKLLRVSPLLNWSYHQIWKYIISEKVPFCDLYDKGYTSIGGIDNTWPNPHLAYKDDDGRISYKPAWRLEDGSLERAGRGVKPKDIITNGDHHIPCECNGDVA